MKITVLLIATFIAGCASTPSVWINTYEGDDYSDSQIARFKMMTLSTEDRLYIDRVRYPMVNTIQGKFRLLPGMHNIAYVVRWYKKGFVEGSFDINMKAGHQYHLRNELNMSWNRQNDILTVKLLDETTEEVVYKETFSHPSILGNSVN